LAQPRILVTSCLNTGRKICVRIGVSSCFH
jgi:hypothetical protein